MEYINAIGRRKSSVARVYLSEGTGNSHSAVCGKAAPEPAGSC